MTLQDFGQMTISTIREDGLDGYIPTFVLPDTDQIRTIHEIPPELDPRDVVQSVARESNYHTREFIFALRTAPQQITIGHFRPGHSTEFMEISETPVGYSITPLTSRDWWQLP